MKYRKLRIAWSVAWGVLAVSLCWLWARSYSLASIVYLALPRQAAIGCDSAEGRLYFYTLPQRKGVRWEFRSTAIESRPAYGFLNNVSGYARRQGHITKSLRLPHWLLTISFAVIAALPWVPRHFSLRTLLIAMAVVSVAMGLTVYMLRD